MKLHIMPPSPNSMGCMIIVKNLGLEIEIENAFGKTRTEEFLKINPCHCCPTLEFGDGSQNLWESNAVMRYLCDSSDKGEKFYPKDLKKRALIDMALDFRQCSLYPCIPAIGYIAFGFPQDTAEAKKQFKNLLDEHFVTLTDLYLKDTDFVFSETPTIADLSIAFPLTLIKARAKFWEAVPEKVKDYHKRVVDAFPEVAEGHGMLEGMCSGCTTEGHDAEP